MSATKSFWRRLREVFGFGVESREVKGETYPESPPPDGPNPAELSANDRSPSTLPLPKQTPDLVPAVNQLPIPAQPDETKVLQSEGESSIKDSVKIECDVDSVSLKSCKREPDVCDLSSRISVLLDGNGIGYYEDPYQKWIKSNQNLSAPAVDLVIGVDFGTSCSKVIVGDPSWRNRSYPVRFSTHSDGISDFLFPTQYDNEVNLKMRLMENPQSPTLRDLVACYLAGVISKTCEYFCKNGPAEYHSKNILWSLNIGFPRKSEAEASDLWKAYREIMFVAVRLSSQSNHPTPAMAEMIRNGVVVQETFLPEKRINLYPEIAAQLAGYITSAQRRSGPLLLMDVGAGTLDVSTLILHEDLDEQVLSFHCCDVRDFGILRYYSKVTFALNECCPGSVTHLMEYYQDGLKTVPEELEKMVRIVNPSIKAKFVSVRDAFRLDVLNQAFGSLWRFRTRLKAANANQRHDPWGKNLRVFLTGGGSRSRFFVDCLVGDLEQEVAKKVRCWDDDPVRRKRMGQGFRVEQLPVPGPGLFPGFPQHIKRDFDRLSVAYGLAFGGPNLMKITSSTQDNGDIS